MNRRSILAGACVLALVACSSSSSSTGGATDGGGTSDWVCGAGTLTGTGHVIDPVTLGPVAGATVSGPGCNSAVADDRGYVTVKVPQGQVVKFDVTGDGRLNEHAEITFLKSGFTLNGDLFPATDKTTILTGWTDANGYIGVILLGDASDGGPCASNQGATVSVKGHPEIAAGYLSDTSTRSTTLTSTGSIGLAVLGPVPAGTYEVEAAKAGCHSTGQVTEYYQVASTIDVKANYFSALVLQLAQ